MFKRKEIVINFVHDYFLPHKINILNIHYTRKTLKMVLGISIVLSKAQF